MSFWRRREVQGTILVLPYLIVFALFVVFPLLSTVIGSFMGGGDILANYRAAFAMPQFRTALLHTVLHTVLAAALVVLLAFPAAFVIHREIRRRKRLQFLLTLPYATSFMALSMIWLMFFNSENGLVNKLLPLFGLTAQNWLESPALAFVCVFTLVFWRGFCFTLFNCVHAMDRLPKELYEFAAISGASNRQMLIHITLPHLLPTLMYVIPTAVVSVLTTFEPILLLNYAGMSLNVTNSLTYMYFHQANIGSSGVASAIAVLMLVPIMLCCHLYSRRIFGRKAVK